MNIRLYLAYTVQIVAELLLIAIFIRVIVSWLRPGIGGGQGIATVIENINAITERKYCMSFSVLLVQEQIDLSQ